MLAGIPEDSNTSAAMLSPLSGGNCVPVPVSLLGLVVL